MIIDAQTNFCTTPGSRSPEQVLTMAVNITKGLARICPSMTDWYALPSSREERTVSLKDSEAILMKMARKIEGLRTRFGDYEELGASIILSNVDNNRDWRKPGVVVLSLNPRNGSSYFRISGIEPFGEAVSSIMLNAMICLVKEMKPAFACTDVKAETPDKGLVAYQFDRRLYQHREFFGWMGFVPAQITHAQIRDAHAVHPVDGLGTVIVSVPGVFDPTDDAQVDKVHRVEMDLASYDLLPVTDPSIKG
ncbi:Imm52 family immunity protein [Stenotrophomonas sp. ZAC14A_NAIMI4_1]|uniref:Imm52 family immunity protein n=1 Tax=Stenotrophomonas sp. ZAC14A_NAIMI4_1 TaxID=2072412 RepID=UPI000D53C522|nr:Imm52 family immunity protein [Stenotrophomonas sp. ZAC14A_NAIMI4_1]AWH44063.1 hypothetical protein C1926_02990 [Stenotrophomonas sp. ZAC14A_NAIMI4_1]